MSFELINRIIYSSLHWIRILSLSNYTPNSVTKRDIYKDSLTAYNNINNSAFIVNIMTVSYLLAFHEVKPLYNLIINT